MRIVAHREASGVSVFRTGAVLIGALSIALGLLLGLAPGLALLPAVRAAGPIDLIGPAGSGRFGTQVTVLPNGNLVITDPSYDLPDGTADAGAVYLYSGRTGALITALTGSHPDDLVGVGGVTALTNGHYVVRSPNWDNGTVADAGAVTWGSGTTGITGTVSAANSLVGSQAGDQVGSSWVLALPNGHYMVRSPDWDNGALEDAGAITWGDGTRGITGTVSVANSLVGSHANDLVGYGGVVVLPNGHYVLPSPFWDNGTVADAGAVTWGDGTRGVTGTISAANSLVGSHAYDEVGWEDWYGCAIWVLPNGHYVVRSAFWDNGTVADAGAVTWGDGTRGITGTVSAANSLVGSQTEDRVGYGGVTVLLNGHYVVRSPHWNNGTVYTAGAVTWGDGTRGIAGAISAANSLVGSQAGDGVGSGGVTALPNGHYVVRSPYWNNGTSRYAGAVTWGDGAKGITGTISAASSLVGSQAEDWVGIEVTTLANGNYVVYSPWWHNGTSGGAGAVTWGDGTRGITGSVSPVNSLVGSQVGDGVGRVVALTNGHYVVFSPYWHSGTVYGAGAVTWGDGTRGITGTVSVANSLVGSQVGDRVGDGGVTVLPNGHYVVPSPWWDNGTVAHAGAVTWGDGTRGITGTVSAANSLVGSQAEDRVGYQAEDRVGYGGVTALTNGNYVVLSPDWDSGTVADAGAVTWGDGTTGITGTVSVANSLVGSQAEDLVGGGYGGVTALTNGNYVVLSPSWDNGAVSSAGAVTWGSGTTGITGTVSAANSLVGSQAADLVGVGVATLANGHYVVPSPFWDNGTAADAGAVTWGDGTTGITGTVCAANSVLGAAPGGFEGQSYAYDYANWQLVVGRPADNRVTLWRTASTDRQSFFLPLILRAYVGGAG